MFTNALHQFLDWRPIRRFADRGFSIFAHRRLAELDALPVARHQEQTLIRLVAHAKETRFGRDHDFGRIRSVEDFQRLVPLRNYEQLWNEYWKLAFPNLKGVSWPEQPPYFALSSGTTCGSTKYVPVTGQMLESNKKAGLTLLASYAANVSDCGLFSGQMFFLGGSTELVPMGMQALGGDLSGIAAREAPSWIRPYSFPPLELALLSDWEEKIVALARESASRNITLLSGVPSWMLVLFDRLKQVTGKASVPEIWPDFRLLIHGGVKFEPYRELFRREFLGSKVRFLECYPCSEGFVGFEDARYDLLRLLPDHEIFYEFVPVEELDSPSPVRHTVANLEPGAQYAIVLTTCAGLWAYVIGDTVAFERRYPPLFRFTGRTKYFLSAFGEHLISEEVERAVSAAARSHQTAAVDFHVGPMFPVGSDQLGRHLYVIEFEPPCRDPLGFSQCLDEELCRINDDYRAHRSGGVGMGMPQVVPVPRGTFARWMRTKGKLGGQHKVPRMDNTGQMTRELLAWLEASTSVVGSFPALEPVGKGDM